MVQSKPMDPTSSQGKAVASEPPLRIYSYTKGGQEAGNPNQLKLSLWYVVKDDKVLVATILPNVARCRKDNVIGRYRKLVFLKCFTL